jgi:hypothetical protein
MEIHLGVKAATYPDGTKLSDVMTWNNYGTKTIPPRPIFQIAAENILSSEEIAKHAKAYLKNVLNYELYNQGDLKQIELVFLQAIGSQSIAEAKRIIKAGAELQENAPSTTRAKELSKSKGVGKPLYDTGLMIKNLAYEIED